MLSLLNKKDWKYIRRVFRLTEREIEVAELACSGLTNIEIADELGIAPGTVKTHLKNIYRSIRVRNKISMLLLFVEEVKKIRKK